MEAEKFTKYLTDRYEMEIQWYNKKSIFNKKLNNIFQILVIILAAILPISAVLEFKWITVILAAIVAIGTGILKYCRFEEHWQNYRTTCETLRKEKHFYDAKIGEYKDSNCPEELFVERVESLISQENTKWFMTVRKNEECNKE
jgi:hypothetical protein